MNPIDAAADFGRRVRLVWASLVLAEKIPGATADDWYEAQVIVMAERAPA